jgi:DNA invertase Pin-like site-specific DNA recombinase
VSAPFVIYTRASEKGADGELSSRPEDQYADCLRRADQLRLEVYYDEEDCNEVASGALVAKDRKLGELIERIQSGEFAGIIVRDKKRFARDQIAGSLALADIIEAGGRFIDVWTGFDSEDMTPEMKQLFQFDMAIAEAERERNKLRRKYGKEKFVNKGGYAAIEPVGYDKDKDGKLRANADAEVVREIFRRRASGEGFSEIARYIPPVRLYVGSGSERKRVKRRLGRSGVRRIVMNRAYLGEQRIPADRRGDDPKVIKTHKGLVTSAQWEAANAIEGRAPIHNGLGRETQLHGLIRCGVCGHKLHVLSYGKDRRRRRYTCTHGKCAVGIPAHEVDRWVTAAVYDAIKRADRRVAEALNEDARHDAAVAAVEQAQRDYAQYRDSIDIQRELGPADFAAGLRVRKEAIDLARSELRKLPKPKPLQIADAGVVPVRRLVSVVHVYPRSAHPRVTLRWRGSTKDVRVKPYGGMGGAATLEIAA